MLLPKSDVTLTTPGTLNDKPASC